MCYVGGRCHHCQWQQHTWWYHHSRQHCWPWDQLLQCFVCTLLFETGWMDFHDVWCSSYATKGKLKLVHFNFPQSVIPWQMLKIGLICGDSTSHCAEKYKLKSELFVTPSLSERYELLMLSSISSCMNHVPHSTCVIHQPIMVPYTNSYKNYLYCPLSTIMWTIHAVVNISGLAIKQGLKYNATRV